MRFALLQRIVKLALRVVVLALELLLADVMLGLSKICPYVLGLAIVLLILRVEKS